MTKATEKQLALLHKRVAETMVSALDCADKAEYLYDKYQHGDVPTEILKFLQECKIVNPSLLSAATKFLKDNDISCDMEDSGGLAELQEKLGKKASVTRIPLE